MFDFVFSEVFFFGLRENSARLQAPGGTRATIQQGSSVQLVNRIERQRQNRYPMSFGPLI
jgi:hypothetical protein